MNVWEGKYKKYSWGEVVTLKFAATTFVAAQKRLGELARKKGTRKCEIVALVQTEKLDG
jgi:hypothetical protein